jgi:IS4 transposase
MSSLVRPTPEELLPLFPELLPRPIVEPLVKASGVKLYWRLLTPLVILWGFIFQRLNPDHTCDALVSHLHSGAADHLVPMDPMTGPLSKCLTSESTSAYVQGRNRLPLSVLQGALRHVFTILMGWLRAEGATTTWKGHAVRLLDGTTFRLRPTEALLKEYTQASNQTGTSYWVVVRSVAAFCGFSQALVAYAEGPTTISEPALIRAVVAQDPEPNSLYIEDRNFGGFRLVQVARACHKQVVTRLNARTARLLFKTLGLSGKLRSGADYCVAWAPQPWAQLEPDLPTTPVEGRLLYVRLCRKGFRPIDLYLFTTLLDPVLYPLEEIVALYGLRWQAEIDYRHIKTTLEMDEFDVKSPQMFRKELVAGLLTYNLICALMVKAALKANLSPSRLSFSRCWRRVRDLLVHGVPGWVIAQGGVEDYVLGRLAKCTLPRQRNKVAHEPRKVRRRPAAFPALKGDRQVARQQVLQKLSGEAIS